MSDEERNAIVKDGAVDLNEAAKFSGIGRTFLYKLILDKRIVSVKLGKKRLIPRAELTRILAENLVQKRNGAEEKS